MSEHKATVSWALNDGEFLKGRYSREHRSEERRLGKECRL